MGKIRIKTLGSPEEEKKQKEKAEARKETRLSARQAKKTRLAESKPLKKTTKTPGLKGGQRLVSMEPTEEELAKITPPAEEEIKQKTSEAEGKTPTKKQARKRGQKYLNAVKLVDKNRLYPLPEALTLIKKSSFSRFDGSVEIHIQTQEKGVWGNVKLPHSTGKKTRVAIADDKVLAEISSGKINFDVLIASPEFMPKLAKFAKVLGPRGLMPNPKAQTITAEPEKAAEKFKSGEIRFKTEAQAPLIHLVIGKVSFPEKNLEENVKVLLSTIGLPKIQKVTLSSTMGPGIKVDLASVA